MNFRQKVLEAELKTVQVIGLTANLDLARAACERERELREELLRLKGHPAAPSEDRTDSQE